jgi:hypothetical protein
MDELRTLLEQTAELAIDFYETLDERPVFPRASAAGAARARATACQDRRMRGR